MSFNDVTVTFVYSAPTKVKFSKRVGLSWPKSEGKWKKKGKGIALFALNVAYMGVIF